MGNFVRTGLKVGRSLIALFCVSLMLAGCASEPTAFKTGAVINPPSGCIELRKRGGRC